MAVVLVLAVALPLLSEFPGYRSTAEFHAAMEVFGSLLGFAAAYALLARFLAGGRRADLLLGLAFAINAAEDVAHGMLPLSIARGWLTVSPTDAERFIPATYATGRFLMAAVLFTAVAGAHRFDRTDRPAREARVAMALTVVGTVALTALAFVWQAPTTVRAGLVSRPGDLVSATLFLATAWLLVRRPLGLGAQGWLAASAVVAGIGQATIALSNGLFDARFDLGHVAKVVSYALPVFGFIRDQVQVIAREQQTVDELRRIDASRTAFLGSVTHELRTPLAAISGFAQLLGREPEPSPDLRQDIARRIRRNATSLNSLVEDILLFSRVEGDRLQLSPVELDLADVAADVVERLDPVLGGRDVEVAVPTLAVEADLRALEQVLVNLLTNAAFYSPDGSRIRLSAEREGGMARVVVEDDGPGVAPEERDRIFERFHRGRQGQASGRPGTGLGLSVVAELLDAMGGSISVATSPALGGASFAFRLPLTEEQRARPGLRSRRTGT